jgi:hypothetical protein
MLTGEIMKEIELLKSIKDSNNHELVAARLIAEGYRPVDSSPVAPEADLVRHVYRRLVDGLAETVALFVTNNRFSQVMIGTVCRGAADFRPEDIAIKNYYPSGDAEPALPAGAAGWKRQRFLSLRNSSHYEITVSAWRPADGATTRLVVEYNKRGELQGSWDFLA